MRGTESDHVLVLVDGIKIGSATAGTVPFEHIPLSQVERIEVVRGPRSSLYGSEAIGGVIQIFTRHGKGKQQQWELSGGIGSESTYQLHGGVFGSSQASWYSLFASYLQTDGFNACQGSVTAGCFTIEPDEDGYDNKSLHVRMGHRLGANGNLEAFAWRSDSNTQYDSSFDNEADLLQQLLGIKLDYAANEQWLINLNVGNGQDEIENFGHQVTRTFFDTNRTTVSLLNSFFLPHNQLFVIGYDYQQDEVDSSTAYTVNSRDNQGLFAEYKLPWARGDMIIGLRQDDNEQFGQHTTGNISIGYQLRPQTRLFLSYGTAFKAPSFNELYYPDYGNPNLEPEKAQSIELGLSGSQSHSSWFLNTYHSRIEQLIATNFDPTTNNYFADNINKAKITGLETGYKASYQGWELGINLSWLKPEDETTGNILPRRAEKAFQLALAERRGPARLEFNFLAQGPRYDDSANTQRLGGYGIFNLLGEYNHDKNWSIRLRLENLLDKEYQTASFYNTPGRSWLLTFNYQG
jgi:vitamin B12 transporter